MSAAGPPHAAAADAWTQRSPACITQHDRHQSTRRNTARAERGEGEQAHELRFRPTEDKSTDGASICELAPIERQLFSAAELEELMAVI